MGGRKHGTVLKKRNCFGCRAYWYDEVQGHCDLGYTVKDVHVRGFRETVPQEVCPKPRTNLRFVELSVKEVRE